MAAIIGILSAISVYIVVYWLVDIFGYGLDKTVPSRKKHDDACAIYFGVISVIYCAFFLV